MKIRNVSIEIIEYEGQFACDVNVTFTDNETMIIPTKLYVTDRQAYGRAKEIQAQLFHTSEKELDYMFKKYLAKRVVNPFKDILDSIPMFGMYEDNQ